MAIEVGKFVMEHVSDASGLAALLAAAAAGAAIALAGVVVGRRVGDGTGRRG